MENNKKLYRSRTSTVVGGVAGGLGEYLNVDPVIFRIIFLAALLFGGGGLVVYIILWIAVPIEPYPGAINGEKSTTKTEQDMEDKKEQKKQRKEDGGLLAGLLLIAIGVMFLVDRFVPKVDFGDLWPLILVVAGIVLIKNSYQQKK